jgi:hypothetical protein
MDGVAALRAVLVANGPLTAMVPNKGIFAGPAPLGTTLPLVMLESVSKVDRNLPSPGSRRHVRERVQATVIAADYLQQKAVLRAVRRAAADKLYPEVPGISGVTIHTDSAGPDFHDPAYAGWRGSQDFMVTYSEER